MIGRASPAGAGIYIIERIYNVFLCGVNPTDWSIKESLLTLATRQMRRAAETESVTVWFANLGKAGKPPPTCVDVPVALEQVYIEFNVCIMMDRS